MIGSERSRVSLQEHLFERGADMAGTDQFDAIHGSGGFDQVGDHGGVGTAEDDIFRRVSAAYGRT